MDTAPRIRTLALVAALAAGASGPAGASTFSFGAGAVLPGSAQVLPGTRYSAALGYGFEDGPAVTSVDRGGPDPARAHFCTSDRPFLFSVAVPGGNYEVAVVLGDLAGESTTTIKSELRRLEVEEIGSAFRPIGYAPPPGRYVEISAGHYIREDA